VRDSYLKARDHAAVASEGLMEWNEALEEKGPEDLPGLLPGLFVIMNDVLLAIHYDLQAMIESRP
jgi:hypothetical protein